MSGSPACGGLKYDDDGMKPRSATEAAVEQERYKLTTYDCEKDRNTPAVVIYSMAGA